MSLGLDNALSHYRSLSDSTHKFWGYFQLVAIASVGYVWAPHVEHTQEPLLLFSILGLAFGVFVLLNWRLVVISQADAVNAADCLKKYAAKVEVPAELKPIIDRIQPDSAFRVGTWHAALSLAALAAIGWRYHSVWGHLTP